jgi:uncharacterized protein (TIGR03435 family)
MRTLLIAGLVLASTAAMAQAPAFEVASIKPNVTGINFTRVRFQPNGEFVATNATLRALIIDAYQVRDSQLAGAPAWAGSTRFDVVAKAAADARSDDWRAMLRTLLEERFTLVVRRETREASVYAMILADPNGALGPRVKKTTLACAGAPHPFLQPGQSNPCGLTATVGNGTRGLAGGAQTMGQIAAAIGNFATDRLVIDRTGIDGAFDFDLGWTVDSASVATAPAQNELPSIFTAVREQLGLRLQPARGPVEFLIVDSVRELIPD